MNYCIARICGLCRFEFVKGETVAVPGPWGPYHTRPFRRFREDRDHYRPCEVGCRYDEHLVVFHPDCLLYAPEIGITKLVRETYEPWPRASERRLRWLRADLAPLVSQSLGHRLPYEICDMIAQHCVRYHAINVLERFRRDNAVARSFHIDLSKPVWARYASFFGLPYIVSLSNTQSSRDAVRLALPDDPVQVAYVAQDHFGVRELLFASHLDQPSIESRPDLWWDTVHVVGSALRGRTDGSKLRNLSCPGVENLTTYILFDTPQPAPERFRFETFSETISKNRQFTMAELKLGKDVTGYSFCWDGKFVGNVFAIKAHTPGEDLSYYKHMLSIRPRAIWAYIPLREGERMTEFWQRFKSDSKVSIIAVTNKDRVCPIGAYLRGSAPTYEYLALHREGTNDGSFFVDGSLAGINAFASGSDVRSGTRTYGQVASSRYPRITLPQQFLYTTACVENVNGVRLCRVASDSFITGLVFEYTDGHLESVGNVRLDCLEDPISINPCQEMWLKIALCRVGSHDGLPQVVKASFPPPGASKPEGADREYIRITWHGVLDWWVSPYQCRLHHNGQESLCEKGLDD